MHTCHICVKESVRIWLTATSDLSVPRAVPILSTVSAHPPTGSASISVSLRVAPQLRSQLSRVTWINDRSTGFTAQPRPLRKPARSAPFLTLTARHRRAPFTDNPFYPPSLVPWLCCGAQHVVDKVEVFLTQLAQKAKRQHFCCPSKGSNCPHKSERSDSTN